MSLTGFLTFLAALILAPLLAGITDKTKAWLSGRCGAPIIQPYHTLWKLIGKSAVYSRATTWIFRAAPCIHLAATFFALLLIPFGSRTFLPSFAGDIITFVYILALARFALVLGAMDTGSPFEGMGTSREITFSALAEPALLLILCTLAAATNQRSFDAIFQSLTPAHMAAHLPAILLLGTAAILVTLSENSRMPVDDPTTHLELTMIHEAMLLDTSGPDLFAMLLAAHYKLWITFTLILHLFLPTLPNPWADAALRLLLMPILAIALGLIESSGARLRLVRVPQILMGAIVLSAVALIFTLTTTSP